MSQLRKYSRKVSNLIGGLLLVLLAAAIVYAWWVRRSQENASGGRAKILKLGHGLPTEHPVHTAMEFMAKRLRELSGGTMDIAIYPAGMIGSEAECLKQTQNGQLDMSKTSSAVLESSVPEMVAIGLPYVFRDDGHFWKVLNGPIGKKLAELPSGMRGLTYYDSGHRSFYTTKKPIRTPDDLKGMKIRTQQSRSAMDMVSMLGGSPTPIPWGELYTALSQGTVDGAENNLPSFDSGRHLEICKFYTMNDHVMVPDMLMVSKHTWESLTPQQRQWLQQAADESSLKQRELWKVADKQAIAKAKELGVIFIEVDKKAFADKLKPLRENQPEKVEKIVRQIEEVK